MQLDTTREQPPNQGLLLPPIPTSCFRFPIKIKLSNGEIFSEVFFDITTYFTDKNFATKHHMVLVNKNIQRVLKLLMDDQLHLVMLWKKFNLWRLLYKIKHLRLSSTSSNCKKNPIVFGLLGFELHNLDIDWRSQIVASRIRHQGTRNLRTSFIGAKAFMKAAKDKPIYAIYTTSMSSSTQETYQGIPHSYQDYEDVFEKKNLQTYYQSTSLMIAPLSAKKESNHLLDLSITYHSLSWLPLENKSMKTLEKASSCTPNHLLEHPSYLWRKWWIITYVHELLRLQ